MKGSLLRWVGLSAAVMVLLPWTVVQTVRSDAGFAVILLLLFAVDPVYCLLAGFFAGKQLKALWPVPLVSAGLFLTGTWLCFEMGETAFLLYAGLYLLLGLAAMLISRVFEKRREKNG